jgi:hypothetical protein
MKCLVCVTGLLIVTQSCYRNFHLLLPVLAVDIQLTTPPASSMSPFPAVSSVALTRLRSDCCTLAALSSFLSNEGSLDRFGAAGLKNKSLEYSKHGQ